MNNQYFSSASDAGSFMLNLLRNDYFQDFSEEDRIEDPNGLYGAEAEMTRTDDEGEEVYTWNEQQREALTLFAEATPAERADIFKTLA